MKKGTIFIAFCMLIFTRLYSQVVYHPFKIALSAGASLPVGNFGRSVPGNIRLQSAAELGSAVTFLFSYQFKHSSLGMEISAGWQQNNVNDTALAHSVSSFYPTVSQVIAKSDNWHIWKFLIGPVIEIPMVTNKKVSLEFGVLVGILKTTIPGNEFRVIYPDMNRADFASQGPMSIPVAFCYQVNAGLNYQITRSLVVKGSLSFMHAAPDHTLTYYSFTPSPEAHTEQTTYPISSLNMLVGIAYTF